MLRASSSTLALFLCAVLTASTLSSTASAPRDREQTRSGYARIFHPETTVARSVPFDVSGHVSTRRVRREVALQKKVLPGRWRTVATTTTDRRGKFTFSDVRLTASTRLRGHLPAHMTRVPKVKGDPRILRRLPPIATKALRVKVRRQKGRLAAMPAVNQPGPTPMIPRNDSVVSAQFVPPVPGRRVVLERQKGRRWVPYATRREDVAGFAVFNVPPGATYRATAQSYKGIGPVRTGRARAKTKALVFEDTFDAGLDPRWRDFVLPRGHKGSTRTCAITHASQRSVAGGVLRLGIGVDPTMADQECVYSDDAPSGTYMYQSQLSTVRSFLFIHGTAAARIKFSRSMGRHSGFWLQAWPKIAGDPSRGAEIDVIEFFGDDGDPRGRIGSYLHYLGADGSDVKLGRFFPELADMRPVGDTWWDSFHVFSVTWTPTEYVFRVDGHEFWREDRAVSRSPQWLVLSSLVSDWELQHVAPQNVNEVTEVDWVRVWSL